MTGPVAVSAAVGLRYERLRSAALGAPVDPADRVGLTLLLRRGLWSWARAVACSPPEPRHPAPGGPFLHPDRRSDLARLLAGMALAHSPTPSAPP